MHPEPLVRMLLDAIFHKPVDAQHGVIDRLVLVRISIRRERLMEVIDAIEDPRWFWDTEFMIRAERSGRRIAEIPGAYVRREDKTSTVSGLRDSVAYFGRLLRFRAALGRAR